MTDANLHERSTGRAVWNGFRRKCPNCGQGALFDGFLKVADCCPSCNEDFTPQRADDGPAYLTILVVGHIMAPVMHVGFTRFRPDPLVFATILVVMCVALSLFLLPRLKGVVIGIQWAKCMHGFDNTLMHTSNTIE